MVKGIVLKNGTILLTNNIEKIVPEDYNDPDLIISYPFELKYLNSSLEMHPYLSNYTDQINFSIRSDDILTMFSPLDTVSNTYLDNVNLDDQLEMDLNDDN